MIASPMALAMALTPPLTHTPHSTCHSLCQTCPKLAVNQSLLRSQVTMLFPLPWGWRVECWRYF